MILKRSDWIFRPCTSPPLTHISPRRYSTFVNLPECLCHRYGTKHGMAILVGTLQCTDPARWFITQYSEQNKCSTLPTHPTKIELTIDNYYNFKFAEKKKTPIHLKITSPPNICLKLKLGKFLLTEIAPNFETFNTKTQFWQYILNVQ